MQRLKAADAVGTCELTSFVTVNCSPVVEHCRHLAIRCYRTEALRPVPIWRMNSSVIWSGQSSLIFSPDGSAYEGESQMVEFSPALPKPRTTETEE